MYKFSFLLPYNLGHIKNRLLGHGINRVVDDDLGCFTEGQKYGQGTTNGSCAEKGNYLGKSSKFLLNLEVSIDGERTHCHFFYIRN